MKKVRNTKKRLERSVELDKINPETRVQDVAWICSLSESEMVILFSFSLTSSWFVNNLILCNLIVLLFVNLLKIELIIKPTRPLGHGSSGSNNSNWVESAIKTFKLLNGSL
jgi:hypothetical protein